MFTSILIIAVSVALFLYWFRYTCVLTLNTRTPKDYSVEAARANQLTFLQTQEALKQATPGELDDLVKSLEEDLHRVTRLLHQAGAAKLGGVPLEQAVLRIDFWLMKAWYGFSRRFELKPQAALKEMCQIIAYLANTLGERAAVSVRE